MREIFSDMKPDTREAMHRLIAQIRLNIPFELSADDICKDECKNCSIKLLEYLSSEIESWEYRLQHDEIPNFKDLSRLARSGHKIYQALRKNGLVNGDVVQ